MKHRLGNKLRELVAGAVEQQLGGLERQLGGLERQLGGLEELIAAQGMALDDLRARLSSVEGRTAQLDHLLERTHAIAGSLRDDIPWHRRELARVRATAGYEDLWRDREPLITVRIATWNKADLLVDRAIASIQRQTYQNFEIVVVGDACTDDTEERLCRLGDSRVRFRNLPFRGPYPSDPKREWMSAGATATNVGTRMARGSWIAHLDDDDEFTEDHLEVLLDLALAGRYELVYGRFLSHSPGESERVLGAYPPQIGQITLQACMYMRLLSFFDNDQRSWMQDEPGDWNFLRRVMEAGASIGFTDRVVARVWPSGRQYSGSRAPSPRKDVEEPENRIDLLGADVEPEGDS